MEYVWRNLQSLTQWLQRLLYLGIAVDLLSLFDDGYQRGVFRRLIAQSVEATKAVQTANHTGMSANDFISLPMATLALATIILAAVWIYRAATNLRALDVQGLTIGPGWAVGWYFIPIANFWKPYQAMREIWQASSRTRQWQDLATPSLLPAWWGLWLLGFFVPLVITSMGIHAGAEENWLHTNTAQMVGTLIDIPQNLLFSLMVGRIWQMQSVHVAPPSSPTLASGIVASDTHGTSG